MLVTAANGALGTALQFGTATLKVLFMSQNVNYSADNFITLDATFIRCPERAA